MNFRLLCGVGDVYHGLISLRSLQDKFNISNFAV